MPAHTHPARPAMIATFVLFFALFLIETEWSDPVDATRVGKIAYGYASSGGVHIPSGTQPPAFNTSAPPPPPPVVLPPPGPKCGNGVIDEGEECDLGQRKNAVVGDRFKRAVGCMSNCMVPECGDGILWQQGGEECEPLYRMEEQIDPKTGTGTVKKTPYIPQCGEYCTHPVIKADQSVVGGCYWARKPCLGDLPAVTESMFDKYARNGSAGSVRPFTGSAGTLRIPQSPAGPTRCGNGTLDAGEACDQGERNSSFVPNACRPMCTLPRCGDGVVDPLFGEICDAGASNSNTQPNTCRLSCTPPICGDGVTDKGEECDGGSQCSDACKGSSGISLLCGNGSLDTGEICDDGNRNDGDGCSTFCATESGICGNGIRDLGEECDDGNQTKGDGCSAFCTLETSTCGNRVIDLGEECDDGDKNSDADPDRCRSTCKKHSCGDGTLDSEEECDDGNKSNRDECTNFCLLPDCGDGFRQTLEQCDDGNRVSNDGCSKRCLLEGDHGAANPQQQNLLMLVFIITSIVGFTAGTVTAWKWMGMR
ncbi:DUF4215 domain-containing protein [Candidatus Peregrinibacteria bacterium]|nr:DUF4215 domain-containing protein [Candidatus Peregrinibacteria bacterium]